MASQALLNHVGERRAYRFLESMCVLFIGSGDSLHRIGANRAHARSDEILSDWSRAVPGEDYCAAKADCDRRYL